MDILISSLTELIDYFIDWLIDLLIYKLIDWLGSSLINGLIELLIESLIDFFLNWFGWFNDLSLDWFIQSFINISINKNRKSYTTNINCLKHVLHDKLIHNSQVCTKVAFKKSCKEVSSLKCLFLVIIL